MWMTFGIIWVVFGVALLLLIGTMIGLGIWTYRDAKSRGLEAGMWTAIVVMVPNFIGLLLYFLVGRKQQKIKCPSCEAETEQGKPHCSNCGAVISPQEKAVSASPSNSKKPLIIALVCVILTFVLVIGVSVASIFIQPEMFSAPNITIGQAQTMRPGVWKLSFWYFDGEKARAIEIKQGKPNALNIDAEIEKGTVEMGISIDGKEENRISLNELNSTYVWDLSGFPDNTKITLHLYADEAKGSVNMDWRE